MITKSERLLAINRQEGKIIINKTRSFEEEDSNYSGIAICYSYIRSGWQERKKESI